MNTNHERVALVTGANRGLGKEISGELCKKGYAVFMASRDVEKGRDAVRELCEQGYEAIFLHMDVTDPVSIKNAYGAFSQKASHLDVLVNNAAILEDSDRHISICKLNAESLERTLKTNLIGPIMVIQDFLPFLEKSEIGGRIINMTSDLGSLSHMQDDYPAYSLSKTALNAMTRQFAAALAGKNIAVNCTNPGWVQTSMGGSGANRSVEKGAETAVWLATEAPLHDTGKFWKDKREVPW
ncbi:SDR family NAD(P)-dependent oxidoreductase [Larkinella knui]|uniref:SDR family NAD(P)-dependent oxidoreductase n=1 Tax=Larkinella knui TaxID=2025310 RepID=A0A3P1CEV7_9BACT|nr:SDR family NAD(P)-dependent oxidoreductase [Larkinella knui]RRB11626.1 SDR family NAD(P)-dependent oxidoreductase [Larkinella knui]